MTAGCPVLQQRRAAVGIVALEPAFQLRRKDGQLARTRCTVPWLEVQSLTDLVDGLPFILSDNRSVSSSETAEQTRLQRAGNLQ